MLGRIDDGCGKNKSGGFVRIRIQLGKGRSGCIGLDIGAVLSIGAAQGVEPLGDCAGKTVCHGDFVSVFPVRAVFAVRSVCPVFAVRSVPSECDSGTPGSGEIPVAEIRIRRDIAESVFRRCGTFGKRPDLIRQKALAIGSPQERIRFCPESVCAESPAPPAILFRVNIVMPALSVRGGLNLRRLGKIGLNLRGVPVFGILRDIGRRRAAQPDPVPDKQRRLRDKDRDIVCLLESADFHIERELLLLLNVIQKGGNRGIRNFADKNRSAGLRITFKRAAGNIDEFRIRLLQIIAVQSDVVGDALHLLK